MQPSPPPPPPTLPLEVAQMLVSANPEMAYVNQYYYNMLRYPNDSGNPNLKYLQAPAHKTIADLTVMPASIQGPMVLDLSHTKIEKGKFEYLHLPNLLSQYPSVNKFILQRNMIDSPFAGCLSAGLLRCPLLETLTLHRCGINGPGFEIIANALLGCKNLRHLDLSENEVCHGEHGKFQCNLNGMRVLADCDSIITLNLSKNGLEERGHFLAGLLNMGKFAGLRTLDLTENWWSKEERQKLMSVDRCVQISLADYPGQRIPLFEWYARSQLTNSYILVDQSSTTV